MICIYRVRLALFILIVWLLNICHVENLWKITICVGLKKQQQTSSCACGTAVNIPSPRAQFPTLSAWTSGNWDIRFDFADLIWNTRRASELHMYVYYHNTHRMNTTRSTAYSEEDLLLTGSKWNSWLVRCRGLADVYNGTTVSCIVEWVGVRLFFAWNRVKTAGVDPPCEDVAPCSLLFLRGNLRCGV